MNRYSQDQIYLSHINCIGYCHWDFFLRDSRTRNIHMEPLSHAKTTKLGKMWWIKTCGIVRITDQSYVLSPGPIQDLSFDESESRCVPDFALCGLALAPADPWDTGNVWRWIELVLFWYARVDIGYMHIFFSIWSDTIIYLSIVALI